MSDLQTLWLVLVVLYGWECLQWAGHGTVVVRRWLAKDWNVVRPGGLTGNSSGGWIMAPPLPPFGFTLRGTPLPWSFSPAGLAENGTSRSWTWAELAKLDVTSRAITVSGQRLVRCSDQMRVEYLATTLEKLARTIPETREKALHALAKQTLDTDALKKTWETAQTDLQRVRFLGIALFTHLFMICPLAIQLFGLSRVWLWLLLSLFPISISIGYSYHRIHKAQFPASGDDRFSHTLVTALSPVSAIRAHDLLARPLLESFHPLALVQAFGATEPFRIMAKAAVRDLRFPVPAQSKTPDAAASIHQWWRDCWKQELEAWLSKHGQAADTLLVPPARMDDRCVAYCPRCEAQYTAAVQQCADCGGLALLPLDAPPAPR